jgi:hypothetical protein
MAASAVARSRDWVRRTLIDPEPPLVAVEVRAGSVGVVRAVRERGRLSLAAAASVELSPGALQVSMTQPNVVDPDRFRAALRSALERAGVLGGARAALVLPDPVARVALVPEAELLGEKKTAKADLIRFRLRKGVPFEVREARIAWASPEGAGRGTAPVVVAAGHASVLDGYEDACRAVGLEPGLVEVSTLALVRAFAGGRSGDRLLVNWDEGYVTLVLLRDGWPALFRTLSGPLAASPAEVAREAGQTVLYYRERLQGSGLAEVAVRCAALPSASALAALEEPLGVPPELLRPLGAFGVPETGPAAQAIAGAAAAVGGAW